MSQPKKPKNIATQVLKGAAMQTVRIDIVPEAQLVAVPKLCPPRQAKPAQAASAADRLAEALTEPDCDEAFLNSMIANHPPNIYEAVLITNAAGVIQNANARAARFFLIPQDKLRGHNIIDLISGADRALLQSLISSMKKQHFALIQAYCVRSDNSIFPAEISVSFEGHNHDRLYFFARDITIRKQQEDRLLAQENAIKYAGSGIAMTGLNGVITYVNPAAVKMWGYEQAAELVGQNIIDMLTGDGALFEKALQVREHWSGSLAAKRKDGTVFYTHTIIGRTEDSEGVLSGQVFSFIDISEQIQALQHLRDLDEAKSRFVAEASHELRTPLAIITEFVSLVHDGITGPLNQQQKDCLESALRNCTRLSILLDAMLDLARIEEGKISLDRKRHALEPILRECQHNFMSISQARQQTLQLQIAEGCRDVYCDLESVHKVLTNLVGNAIKFTPEGGQISLICEPAGKFAKISVQDNGPGIPPEMQANIFDAFWQGDKEDGPGAKGTGLGLAIAKNLVKLNGGFVTLESARDQGSRFSFMLPFYDRVQKPALRILVVDDDAAIVDLITRALQTMAAEIELRSTLSGLESLFIAGDYRPHLVILDIGIGGAELLKLLRQQGGASLPAKVLMVSGSEHQLQDMKALGANDILLKPFTVEELLSKVWALLGDQLQPDI